jgi:hypothetical protein
MEREQRLKMKTKALLPIILLAFALGGCAQPGATRSAREIEAARIERGITTEQELIRQLGEPQLRGLDSKGRKMLAWSRMDVSSSNKAWMTMIGQLFSNTDTLREQELVVSFDSQDRVAEWQTRNERRRYH